MPYLFQKELEVVSSRINTNYKIWWVPAMVAPNIQGLASV